MLTSISSILVLAILVLGTIVLWRKVRTGA